MLHARPALTIAHMIWSVQQRATQAVQRLRNLNPNVVISADVEELKEKGDDYFLRFDVVVMTGHSTEDLVRGG